MLKRPAIGMLTAAACVLMGVLNAKRPTSNNPECGANKEHCYHSKSCQCFCAYATRPRNKVAGDSPIFIKHDPEQNYCYCQVRDIEKINHERVARGEEAIPYTVAG